MREEEGSVARSVASRRRPSRCDAMARVTAHDEIPALDRRQARARSTYLTLSTVLLRAGLEILHVDRDGRIGRRLRRALLLCLGPDVGTRACDGDKDRDSSATEHKIGSQTVE